MIWLIFCLAVVYVRAENEACESPSPYSPQSETTGASGWCHQISNGYEGTVRTVAPSVNPSQQTLEEKVDFCYKKCTTPWLYSSSKDDWYASDRHIGYSDYDFWNQFTPADIVSFKVHETNGACYCMTSRPIGATKSCSKQGFQYESYDNNAGYAVYYINQHGERRFFSQTDTVGASGWCHRAGYEGTVRTVAPGKNIGTGNAERAQHCFRMCNSPGTYASDKDIGYSDADFWENFTPADVVSFKVHETNGACYCMTSRPIGALQLCSGEGYTYEDNGGYHVYYIEESKSTCCVEPPPLYYIQSTATSSAGWCHQPDNAYHGTVRTIAPHMNAGATFAEKVQMCYNRCITPWLYSDPTHGYYASDRHVGYSDFDFWETFTVDDIVSFKVHETNGACYCSTSRPVGSTTTCSKEGYQYLSLSGYGIYYVDKQYHDCLVPRVNRNCVDGVTFASSTTTRCGTSWADAFVKCGVQCTVSGDCPAGETCFAGLDSKTCLLQSSAYVCMPTINDWIDNFHTYGVDASLTTKDAAYDFCYNLCSNLDGFSPKSFLVTLGLRKCFCLFSDSADMTFQLNLKTDESYEYGELCNCHDRAECVNIGGEFTCACKSGYTGDGVTSCVNVDECASGVHLCVSPAVCSDTDGSYECICPLGYEGTDCTPTNECEPNPCMHSGVCTDKHLDFECLCALGFSGKSCNECGLGKGYDSTTGRCDECPIGSVNDQTTYDAECAPVQCSAGYGYTTDYVSGSWIEKEWNSEDSSDACQECPMGTESPAGQGQCKEVLCAENERVENYACVTCAHGKRSEAGSRAVMGFTECENTCPGNSYFKNDKCYPCPHGSVQAGVPTECTRAMTDANIGEAVREAMVSGVLVPMDTSAVTNMDGLFKYKNVTDSMVYELRTWDVSRVTSMREMFFMAKNEDGSVFDARNLVWDVAGKDTTRWNNFVAFEYGYAVVEACEGTVLDVTWTGTHNVQETAGSECSSDVRNGSVFDWKSSGAEHQLSGLFAPPGKRRYFKCETHCGTSSARFEVFCGQEKTTGCFGPSLGGKCVLTNTELRRRVAFWESDIVRAEEQYGKISDWDVSYVTNMTELFRDSPSNPDINLWDMSNVVHADYMFYGSNFQGSVDNKDFSSLQTAVHMFGPEYEGRACGKYLSRANAKTKLSKTGANGKDNCLVDVTVYDAVSGWWASRSATEDTYGYIDEWDVSEVTIMNDLFLNRMFGDESLSAWDTGEVTSMYRMFEGSNFNGDIRFWDVRKVRSFARMFFDNAVFSWDLSRWEVFTAEDSSQMTNSKYYVENVLQLDELHKEEITDIYAAYALWKTDRESAEEVYGPIGEWLTHSVLDMSGLFRNDREFNEDISRWVVSSVTDMSHMFENTTFNRPLGDWSTVSVQSMASMFAYSDFDQEIGLWNVSRVESMGNMFMHSKFSRSIGDWDLFATKAEQLDGQFCFETSSSAIHLSSERYSVMSYRECYEHCDGTYNLTRKDIEGRSRLRSGGKIGDQSVHTHFGIVSNQYEPHTCFCLRGTRQTCDDSPYDRVFEFQDMVTAGMFTGNTVYMQPMCGLGWRYRNLDSLKFGNDTARFDASVECNICEDGEHISSCGLCLGEFVFDYCKIESRGFTLEELYAFGESHDMPGLVVDAAHNPVTDSSQVNDGYVNKFACNCEYEDGMRGCLIVNGRKQVRKKEWYVNGETDFGPAVDSQGSNMRYFCELDFLNKREVRPRSGFGSVQCTDDVLLDRYECGLVGGDWDGSCSFCLAPCADPKTGVKEISSERVCLECETGKTVFNNECVQCPDGKFTNRNYAWCGKCPAGTLGVNGACESCGVGLFSALAGSVRCDTCLSGDFSIGTECVTCPQGYSSEKTSSDCFETMFCHRGETDDSRDPTDAGNYCETCDEGFELRNGTCVVTPCANGKFVMGVDDSPTCICEDKWEGEYCDECPNSQFDFTYESPPRCEERLCEAGVETDCLCVDEIVKHGRACVDNDVKEICEANGDTDCMCEGEWTEYAVCLDGEIVLRCSAGNVVHPGEDCFPEMPVNTFDCGTSSLPRPSASCEGICEESDYSPGGRCCVPRSWVCKNVCDLTKETFNRVQLGRPVTEDDRDTCCPEIQECGSFGCVPRSWSCKDKFVCAEDEYLQDAHLGRSVNVSSEEDRDACCVERQLCSEYTAGGCLDLSLGGYLYGDKFEFLSLRAFSTFANDTEFASVCCERLEGYRVANSWFGEPCSLAATVQTRAECDRADDSIGGVEFSSSEGEYGGPYVNDRWQGACFTYGIISGVSVFMNVCRLGVI